MNNKSPAPPSRALWVFLRGTKSQIWILAARPKTLSACVSPVLMGGALAYHDDMFHGLAFFTALFSAFFIQVGTNFCNDYFDFIKGADTAARLGPTRATQAGLVSFKQMRHAAILAFFMATILGCYLVFRGGWPIVIIGVLSLAAGVFYTAGPYALAYVGLGDIFVLIFFGPVASLGTYYVQTLQFSPVALIAGFAPGLLSTAILTVNNLRDIDQDRKAHKKTLAVRFGKLFSKVEYVSAIIFAALIPVVLFAFFHAPAAILFSSMVIILAYPLMKKIVESEDAQVLNAVLGKTGKLTLLFGVLFSLGLIL